MLFKEPKVGDKVFVHSRGWGNNIPSTRTIEEITKGGNIKVNGRIYYPHSGFERGSGYLCHWIKPFSEEQDLEYRKERKIHNLKSYVSVHFPNFKDRISLEDLEAISEILKKYEEKVDEPKV